MTQFNLNAHVENEIKIIQTLLKKAKDNGRCLSKSEARDVANALNRIRDVVVSEGDKSDKNLEDIIIKQAPKVAYMLWKLVEMFNE